jgi:TrmH family RNA methyltransferase
MAEPLILSSLQNPRVKDAVRLRQRSHRDETGRMLVEGYRELRRARAGGHPLAELFYCPAFFQGANNEALLEECRGAGATLTECSSAVFEKLSYRDRPDGLLAVAPQVRRDLADVTLPDPALVVVAEAIEKPGNLGTILRTADAAGAHAVLVCDRCTDLNNPNVVRASVGTLFTLPVVEAATERVLPWLRERGVRILAATPHAETVYSDADLTQSAAIVLGTEQYGLTDRWMEAADIKVRIPMLGVADSLNVAAAATILLFEAVRQRGLKGGQSIFLCDEAARGAARPPAESSRA